MTPQHIHALRRADEIRIGRANAKKSIRAGKLSVLDALSLRCCQTATISTLLKAQFRWGDRRVQKLLSSLNIGPTRRVEDLSESQLQALRRSLS